jgi:dUTP pyrophosphatase
MERIEVFIKMRDGATVPAYATDRSSGVDLCALVDGPVVLGSMERALIPTGIFIDIPEGFEAEVRPRSGIAHKHGVTVLNTPGTIDSDYRGEVKVILINLGREPFTIRNGDRIAQMVFKRLARVDFRPVVSLADTCRGEGGFGSTGV